MTPGWHKPHGDSCGRLGDTNQSQAAWSSIDGQVREISAKESMSEKDWVREIQVQSSQVVEKLPSLPRPLRPVDPAPGQLLQPFGFVDILNFLPLPEFAVVRGGAWEGDALAGCRAQIPTAAGKRGAWGGPSQAWDKGVRVLSLSKRWKPISGLEFGKCRCQNGGAGSDGEKWVGSWWGSRE